MWIVLFFFCMGKWMNWFLVSIRKNFIITAMLGNFGSRIKWRIIHSMYYGIYWFQLTLFWTNIKSRWNWRTKNVWIFRKKYLFIPMKKTIKGAPRLFLRFTIDFSIRNRLLCEKKIEVSLYFFKISLFQIFQNLKLYLKS